MQGAVLLVVLAQALPVPNDARARARAQVLLDQGTMAYQQRDFAGALAKFEAAYALYPSPKLQFDIGQANRDLGRPVRAVEAFEQFLAAPAGAAPEIVVDARRSLAELSATLGQIDVDCSTGGASIELDGRTIGMTPLADPAWSLPGRHRVTLRHPGYMPATVDVDVVVGEVRTVAPKLTVLDTPAPPPPAPPTFVPLPVIGGESAPSTAEAGPGFWSRQRWYFWTAAGAAVAFAGGAIVTGIAADDRFNSLQRSCGSTSGGCSDSQIESVKLRARLSDAFWAAAGVSAIATGVSLRLDSHEAGVNIALRF